MKDGECGNQWTLCFVFTGKNEESRMISLGNVKDMIMILSNLVLIRRCVASKPYQFNISVPLTITDI